MNQFNEQEAEGIIRQELHSHQLSLNKVKKMIDERHEEALNSENHDYIQRTYMKICSDLWMEEATAFVTEQKETDEVMLVQKELIGLGIIKDLSQIPKPFSEQIYFKLLKKNKSLLKINDKKDLFEKFKHKCLKQIEEVIISTQIEQRFLEILIGILNNIKNVQSLNYLLDLQKFCDGYLQFEELIDKVVMLEEHTFGGSLILLQEAAKPLKEEKCFLLTDEFKQVIGSYLKPVELLEREVDSRVIIEVKGKHVVVSEILDKLKSKLSVNPAVEEVQFVDSNVIHIDAGLGKDVWHGKNIVIRAELIKVHGKVTWDVSGQDNNHSYSRDAGTGADGSGKNGADGYPGENGGNVLIRSVHAEDANNLRVISNGGKGSNGQDGGKGKRGQNGNGLTKDIFDKWFPFGIRSHFRMFVVNDYTSDHRKTIIKNTQVCTNWTDRGNHFIIGKTAENYEITYSNFTDSLVGVDRGQDFLICKGSPGKAGKPGGEYGLGGQGGNKGEITANSLPIVTTAIQGGNGTNGKCGRRGDPGENGWDIGYTNHHLGKDTRFYGTDKKRKITITYFDDDDTNNRRIWCPYKKKFVAFT